MIKYQSKKDNLIFNNLRLANLRLTNLRLTNNLIR